MAEAERTTGKEIMATAVDNLRQTADASEAGGVDGETFDQVYDKTMRTIAHVAFGECGPGYCKFYGDDVGICDRSCNVPVWDQI